MNAHTQQALKKSIAHWKRMRADRDGCGESPFATDCALCQRFAKDLICEGCPVAKETGQNQCRGTPYFYAREAWSIENERPWKEAAREEIQFLQSLLPKPRRNPRRLTLTQTRNRKSKIQNRKY